MGSACRFWIATYRGEPEADNFDIPPENLVTQGYGEEDLKIPTEAPERENRRVTLRRITPLVNAAETPQQ